MKAKVRLNPSRSLLVQVADELRAMADELRDKANELEDQGETLLARAARHYADYLEGAARELERE